MSNEYFSVPFHPLLPEVFHLTAGSHQELINIDAETAAVFVEIVRGEAGAEVVDPKFLHDLRSRCTEVGALLVVDEIQTGFGRTGPFFASMGVDISTLLLRLIGESPAICSDVSFCFFCCYCCYFPFF